MAAQKEKLFAGLVKNGMTEKRAEELWKLIEPFAAYGFNKAHAASYGKVAYQTAYMKANFPAEYMTAVLSAEAGNIETITETINECERMSLKVLPPDVNESFGDFTVIKAEGEGKDLIRFGLFTIKNLGLEIADAIVKERKAHGPFTSISNFLERVQHRNLNRKSLEALIKAGAFETLGLERGELLANLEDLIRFHQELTKSDQSQTSLFGLLADQSTIPTLKLKPATAATATDKLGWEKELLGLYISGHPLDKYRDKFQHTDHTITKAKEAKEGASVVVAGLIDEARTVTTKKGELMAFVRLSDLTGSIELVIFPSTLNGYRDLIRPEQCIAVRGRASHRNNEPSVVVEQIKALA